MKELYFDPLISWLSQQFALIKDHRRPQKRISLKDILMSALAMFSLKAPSILDFETRTRQESGNLKKVFDIERIPCDTQMRTVLDKVPSTEVRTVLNDTACHVEQAGGFVTYRFYLGKQLVSLDGVEHFCSEEIHCPHCLTRKHRDGTVSYHHQMLCAVMVHPERPTVIPLDAEPILNEDGAKKNDCELNASKRLLVHLAQVFPNQDWLILQDALFATAPNIRQVLANKWSYLIAVKPDSHPTVLKNLEKRLKSGLAHRHEERHGATVYRFSYANQVAFSETDADLKVNVFTVEILESGQVTHRFSFITDLTIRRNNLMKLLKAARCRWKIENETFNTLKNQGYHFEHNYGHGEENLATNLAFIMLIAFLVDQLQQAVNAIFKKIHAKLKTKAKLWDSLRAVFKIKPINSMSKAYLTVALLYDIQLE
jgi:hypothetical protein